jgi:hypothetical protein
MNRQQRRQSEKSVQKKENRLYTYEECLRMMQHVLTETERKYDARYSMCLATALSAPPLNFGPKRVCDVVKLFFDQVDALRIGTVTEEQIREEAEKLGVIIKCENYKLEIYIDPKIKRKGK